MSVLAMLAGVLRSEDSDDIARAQIEALQQRVPYLYLILCINVAALSFTHFAANGWWLAGIAPLILIGSIAYRLVWWLRLQPSLLDIARIRRIRSATTHFAGVVACLTLVWAVSLRSPPRGLGDVVSGPGQVAFFVGITVVSCTFLTMHLRAATILISVSVVGPFSIYLMASGHPIECAIALNLVIVAAAMLYVATAFSADFERMVTNAADLRRLSAQNGRLAASDMLTGLPNRRRFFQELELAGGASPAYAVVIVDLDGFKQVNDLYGHNAGDDVLREVANRLLGAAPAGACVARLGGDEFACLLTGGDVPQAGEVAASLIESCTAPIVCPSLTAHLGASAGVCLSLAGERSPVLVYERADYALFEAKRAGRGRAETFSGMHDQLLRRESSVAQILRAADLARELELVYQPIVSADDHAIHSFEGLLRWRSPELGLVPPNEFIPIAERTDLIFAISRHVLRTAMRDAASWPERITVKVNLSVRDLMSTSQTEALVTEIRRSPIRPNRVTFEVTETILAGSLDQVRANVDALRAAGCAIAIDDFGVGHSNLNYIHALAPEIIKIDRSFITAIVTDAAAQGIVRTIIELVRNVGARSVAEGVETEAQARLLAGLGCDELQGYLFSKPISAELARAMVGHPASLRRTMLTVAAETA